MVAWYGTVLKNVAGKDVVRESDDLREGSKQVKQILPELCSMVVSKWKGEIQAGKSRSADSSTWTVE